MAEASKEEAVNLFEKAEEEATAAWQLDAQRLYEISTTCGAGECYKDPAIESMNFDCMDSLKILPMDSFDQTVFQLIWIHFRLTDERALALFPTVDHLDKVLNTKGHTRESVAALVQSMPELYTKLVEILHTMLVDATSISMLLILPSGLDVEGASLLQVHANFSMSVIGKESLAVRLLNASRKLHEGKDFPTGVAVGFCRKPGYLGAGADVVVKSE